MFLRTYNSLGQFTDDNGDNWRLSVNKKLSVSGSLNSVGSSIVVHSGDGSEISYDFNAATQRYESTSVSNQKDYLTYDGSSQEITWYSSSGLNRDVYLSLNSEWKISSSFDADNNLTEYRYNGAGLISEVEQADGQKMVFLYTNGLLSSLEAQSNGKNISRIGYEYDSENRLENVIVDLTPENTSDSLTYITTYTYEGTSKRIASMTQSDGSNVLFYL